jgi:hypothetical protein
MIVNSLYTYNVSLCYYKNKKENKGEQLIENIVGIVLVTCLAMIVYYKSEKSKPKHSNY